MPQPLPPTLRLGTAEPVEAVAAFVARGLLQPTFNWHDVWQAEHASKFMVAGVAQSDVLQLFQDALREPLAKGLSLAAFADRLRPALQAKGWWGDVEITDPSTGELRTTRFDAARLRLIYDTNLRQSYAAGRWARIERGKARQPLVMYRTMRDERVRASHAAWDGLVLPVDHPFWHAHYPPNGWRCRCTAYALSEADLQRRLARGERLRTEAPPEVEVAYRDPRTGQTAHAPLGVDPAFAYNPGRVGLAQAAELQRTALDALPPPLAKAQVNQSLRAADFRRFLARPVKGEELPVAVVGAADAVRLGAVTRTVLLSGDTAAKQAARHPEVSADDYAAWVQLALDSGEKLQDGPRSLVYVLERDGWVAVVKATVSGRSLYLTSLRRLSGAEARRDSELRRLRAKAQRGGDDGGGADGGAPRSA